MQRYYCGGKCKKHSCFYGWQLNHGAKLFSYWSKHDHLYALIKGSDRHGVLFKSISFQNFECPSSFFKRGVTNCSFGEISAKSNFKNDHLCNKNGTFELIAVDGGTSLFTKSPHDPEHIDHSHCYKLKKRILSDGSSYNYHYGQTFGMPIAIRFLNREGTEIGNLKLKEISDSSQFQHNPELTYCTSSGEQLSYLFELYGSGDTKRAILSEVTPPHAPKIKYAYETFDGSINRKRICKRELPDHRVLELVYADYSDTKVRRLVSPSGTDNQMVTTHTIDRFKKGDERFAQVKSALGGTKTYHWNKNDKRLKTIETHGDKKNPISTERFLWGDQNNDHSHLTGRILEDGDGHLIAYYKYSYSSDGNVKSLSLYGNLTGKHQQPIYLDSLKNSLEDKCDLHKINYQYDANKRRIAKDDGRTVDLYAYLDNTELLSGHHTFYDERIQIRRFYQYDASGAVCQEIIDDGSSEILDDLTNVSQRHIKTITSTPTGLPEIIEENALNLASGAIQFIRKTVNEYDKHGWMINQSVYNSERKLAYKLEWHHDAHGNIIYEKDALGHKTTALYDANDNLIFEHKPDSAPRHLTYDFMNRLICEKFEGENETLYKHYSYDPLGNCISSTDIYGNKTSQEYDSNGRLIKTIYPINSNLGRNPTQKFVRNAQGFATTLTDANGNVTLVEYNIKGKPTSKTYPDGTTEKYFYTIYGDLAKSIAQDGSQIDYTYDPQDREIKKEWFDQKNTLVKFTEKTYNAFHLISEKDGNGTTTYYTYDSAGKLASKKIGNRETQYGYDTLGRKSVTTKLLGNNKSISYVEVYNALNQVIESFTRSPDGEKIERTITRYNAQGKEIEVRRWNQAGKSIETKSYDLFGREISVTNPLQEVIHTTYSCDEGTLVQEVTDPRGVKTITSYNAFGHVSLEQCYSPMDLLVEQIEYAYDLNGNKISRDVTTNKKPIKTQWEYNSLNQLKTTIEAVGTPDQKTTQRNYDSVGRLKSLTKNDGKKLSWTYDALGRKETQTSCDGTLSYSYRYDLNDNLLKAKNTIDQTYIKRTYDIYDQLKSEKLPYGQKFSYGYDLLENVSKVSLPDKTHICYHRQGNRLQFIRRKGPLSYQQTYTSYDKSSNPTNIRLPKKSGTLKINYDLLNRIVKTSSILWEESLTYKNHLLVQRKLRDGFGKNTSNYTYDALDQLMSENGSAKHTFGYDMRRNPIKSDGHLRKFNACNALIEDQTHVYSYDLNGNRTSDGVNTYKYDALDRLIEVTTLNGTYRYEYDALNRRIARFSNDQEEYFLWQKQQEIGTITKEGIIQELKVIDPLDHAVALELQGTLYIPVHDVMGHLRALLDDSGVCVATYRYSAFGEEQVQGELLSPWRYSGKRIDAETGFTYFGERFYDTKTFCWLTSDPLEDIDGPNHYAYVRNNPMKYTDRDGRFVWVIPFLAVSFGAAGYTATIITAEALLGTLIGGALGVIVYQGAQKLDQAANTEPVESTDKKKKSSHPDRSLPQDANGNHIPDSDAAHSQLGTGRGRKGEYPNAREFGENGKTVRDIEFTDHGRPQNHTNPHQHEWMDNPSGGSKIRGVAKPL